MTVKPRQIKCRSMLQGMGASLAGASALVGNFCQESGPDLPTVFRTGKLDHGSQGLAQWRLGRLTAYMNYVRQQKVDLITPGMTEAQVDKVLWPWYGRLDFQTEFVVLELKKDYPLLWAKLSYPTGVDVAALAADVCWQYERPNKELSGIANRVAYAKAIAADHTGLAEVPADPTVVDHLTSTAETHETQANGGIMAAGAAGLGAAGVFLSNYVNSIPRWEIIAIVILLALMAMCVVSALASKKKAVDVRAALPHVSAVPKPVDPPAPDPVMPSPAERQAAVDTGSAAFRAAVQKAVEAQLALQDKDKADPMAGAVVGITKAGMDFHPTTDPAVAADTEVVKDLPVQTAGATMTIKRAGE